MNVLIIDNYDSFTYNLYQYVGEILNSHSCHGNINVVRNDKILMEDDYFECIDRIIISPGPGRPDDVSYFGSCMDIIRKYGESIPILGVCLGMQGICSFFGAEIVRAKRPTHGKISLITHDGKGVFKSLPQSIEVMRYHSLVVDENTLPESLVVTSRTSDEIMGVRHKSFPLEGIQFHPESFATEAGKNMVENFIFGDSNCNR